MISFVILELKIHIGTPVPGVVEAPTKYKFLIFFDLFEFLNGPIWEKLCDGPKAEPSKSPKLFFHSCGV